MVKPHSPIVECKQLSSKQRLEVKKNGSEYCCQKHNKDLKLLSVPSSEKKVAFLNRVFVKDITHRKDTSEKVAREQWLRLEEYEKIRNDIKYTLSLMRYHAEDPSNCNSLDTSLIYCTRGLECKTIEGQTKRRNHKKVQKQAVLRVQEVLQSSDEAGMSYDPEFMAMISCQKSSESVAEARAIALQDEQEAQKYYKEDIEEMTTI